MMLSAGLCYLYDFREFHLGLAVSKRIPNAERRQVVKEARMVLIE